MNDLEVETISDTLTVHSFGKVLAGETADNRSLFDGVSK